MFFFSSQNDEEKKEWVAENECGGVRKSPLAGRGRRAVSGREGRRLILPTIMWLNQIPSLLSTPLLSCSV